MDYEEQRIWQRVTGVPSPPGELECVLRLVTQSVSAFRELSKAASGRDRELLATLSEGARATAAALRGILLFSGDSLPDLRFPSPVGESRNRVLSGCIHRSRQIQIAFASRIAEPEFGPAFQALAAREQMQMARALELLGRWSG